jgi:hypothetical protein
MRRDQPEDWVGAPTGTLPGWDFGTKRMSTVARGGALLRPPLPDRCDPLPLPLPLSTLNCCDNTLSANNSCYTS